MEFTLGKKHTSNKALELRWFEHKLKDCDHACLTWSQCLWGCVIWSVFAYFAEATHMYATRTYFFRIVCASRIRVRFFSSLHLCMYLHEVFPQ